MHTTPTRPMAMPTIWSGPGRRRSMTDATTATRIGQGPVQHPGDGGRDPLLGDREHHEGEGHPGHAEQRDPGPILGGDGRTGGGEAAEGGVPEGDPQHGHRGRRERLQALGDQEERRAPDAGDGEHHRPLGRAEGGLRGAFGGGEQRRPGHSPGPYRRPGPLREPEPESNFHRADRRSPPPRSLVRPSPSGSLATGCASGSVKPGRLARRNRRLTASTIPEATVVPRSPTASAMRPWISAPTG